MVQRVLFILLAVTALVAANDKGLPASFRLTENLKLWRRGYIRDANKTEFKFQAFDSVVPVTFLWKQVHPSDARPIQRVLGLRHGLKQKGYVVAHRLLLKNGTSREGLLRHILEDGRHVLLSAGRTEMFDLLDVDSVEIAYLPDYRVYSKETLFKRWSRQRSPTNAEEHMEYAERLFLIGRFEDAMEHFKKALELAMGSDLEIEIGPRIDILRGIRGDRELKRAVSDATTALLHGNYDRARAHLERHREVFPKNSGAVRKLLERLQARETRERARRFQREKHEVFDDLIEESVREGLRGFSEARTFVTNQLPLRMRAHFVARWGITGAEYERMLKEARRGAPHFASYGAGSFMVKQRGVKGGNEHSYWNALNYEGRQAWMRAYAAERLEDIFEIVGVAHRDCSKCGGTGRIKFLSLRNSKQWKEVCSRCHGGRTDRAIKYR